MDRADDLDLIGDATGGGGYNFEDEDDFLQHVFPENVYCKTDKNHLISLVIPCLTLEH